MKETLIDIETYCEADIKKCGLYRYVSDPSFEILLIAWATDEGSGFGETRLVDLASGEAFPQELLDDFKDSKVTLIAHNAAFERVSFSRYLHQQYPGQYLEPGAFLSPDRRICTMVMAASLRCPRSSMTRKQTVLAGGLSSQKSCKEIRREPTICKKPSDTP